MTNNIKRLIVDRNVIQNASDKDSVWFKQFCEQGNKLIFTDSLIQEIANNNFSDESRFLNFEIFANKRGLSEVVDSIELWKHSKYPIKKELDTHRPATLEDIIHHATIQDVFDNLYKVEQTDNNKRNQQREKTINTNESISIDPSILDEFRNTCPAKLRIKYAYSIIHNECFIKRYLPCDFMTINQDWFIYRVIQAGLALRFLKVHQVEPHKHDGESMHPFDESSFLNSYYDLSYLEMLFYADGLITAEKVQRRTNDMGFLFQILFGEDQINKKIYRFNKKKGIIAIE